MTASVNVNISPESVRFDDNTMWVNLSDGRVIGVPLTWFPRLLGASQAQRAQVELSPGGLHWDTLDEDISVRGLLQGHGDRTRSRVMSAA